MDKVLQKIIYVYADWQGLSSPALMGQLQATVIRGKEIFAFSYDNNWLKNYSGHSLDPQLQLFSGLQYPQARHTNFGIFLDSAPDRWGRVLMDRRARLDNRKANLMESDYLLGVYDGNRIGALRFKLDPVGPFLDNNLKFASPPWTSLRELEAASLALEQDNAIDNPKYADWLKMLVVPGSSLGGARPKASVCDNNNHLWIAKFPSSYDDINIGAWEWLVYKLAKKCGIEIPEAQIKQFNSRHHTFLSKRFDRTTDKRRVHFASAMTLLQRSDGDDAHSGASYLELAEFIITNGASPTQDLEQLWKRIVFYICISNVDDHLRNHGFIFNPKLGWRLSPAYDINPVAGGNGLKLNIDEYDNAQDLNLALEVIPHFRINKTDAVEIIREITDVIKKWRQEANAIGISNTEQEAMSRAFRIVEEY